MTLTIDIEPLSPVLGAAVRGIDLSQPIDAGTADRLRETFARYGVLCFPGQRISAHDQARFAALFGPVDAGFRDRSGKGGEDVRNRGVMLVSNIRKNGVPVGSLPDGDMQFHSDGAHRARPYRATTLYAIKIPSRGGETLFANLTAAYDALGDGMKAKLERAEVRNIYDYDATHRNDAKEEDNANSVATHALVKTHPDTGRKALYLNRLMTRYIVGMDRAESDALLADLFDHIEKPEFIYAHSWTPGDLLIWDNRCLNHARNDFPAEETRLLRRYTISEEE